MEVIKDGREKKFITTCKSCQSDLKWSQKDIYESNTIKFIVCPICGNHIIVELKY